MRRRQSQWLRGACIGLAVVLAACAAGGASTSLGTPVTITDVRMIAGRWDGP